MNIERKLRKKINAIVVMTGEYPSQIKVSLEEWEEIGEIEKFEGVKLICKN